MGAVKADVFASPLLDLDKSNIVGTSGLIVEVVSVDALNRELLLPLVELVQGHLADDYCVMLERVVRQARGRGQDVFLAQDHPRADVLGHSILEHRDLGLPRVLDGGRVLSAFYQAR